MINDTTKLKSRVAGERTKGSVFTTFQDRTSQERNLLRTELFMKQTFLTSQKSTRPRRHFVPKTVSSRFKIETLLAGPLQTKVCYQGLRAKILPQNNQHSDVKIAVF